MSTSTPKRRLPADWEQHAKTIVALPGRPSVWEGHLDRGRAETLDMVSAISRTEEVILISDPTHSRLVLDRLSQATSISLYEIPLNDCWARDISPLFILDSAGSLHAVDFGFNAWGGKFHPYDFDNAAGRILCSRLQIPYERAEIILEGGSLSSNGQGTAIVVESTLLNDNRNPGMTKAVAEQFLSDLLGIEAVIWLPFGLLGDTDTDGHVDNVAAFVSTTRVLAQAPPSTNHPDASRLRSNLRVLNQARTADGQPLEVVEIPWLPMSPLDTSRPCSYVNIYPLNGQVLIPSVSSRDDDKATALISSLFPDRVPHLIPSAALAYGGGGPHCMTMQVPLNYNH